MGSNSFRLPAEWEKHKSTIICWPHQKDDWPGKFTPIHWVYTEIVKNILPKKLLGLSFNLKFIKKKLNLFYLELI